MTMSRWASGGSATRADDVDGNLASTQLAVLRGALTASLARGRQISSGATARHADLVGNEAQINAALRAKTRRVQLSTATMTFSDAVDRQRSACRQRHSANLDITPVNDAPATTPVTLAAIAEDSGARLITQAELLANASRRGRTGADGDQPGDPSGNGTLVDNGNGTWSYTPAPTTTPR